MKPMGVPDYNPNFSLWMDALARYENGKYHMMAAKIVSNLVNEGDYETLEICKTKGITTHVLVAMYLNAGSLETFKQKVNEL
jgi:hypothetical protein